RSTTATQRRESAGARTSAPLSWGMPMPTLIVAALVACGPTPEPTGPPLVQEEVALRSGDWRAWLESPGGELPFELDLSDGNGGWQAWIRNGKERIAVDEVRVEDGL